jgi:hypothetical protein
MWSIGWEIRYFFGDKSGPISSAMELKAIFV